jgi:DNA polymerase
MIGDRELAAFEDRFGSAGRALSRLIRPTIAAPEGRTLVWGDWSAIEARVLPWLADTRGAHKVLDIFRASDADPSVPDIYMVEAGNVLGMDPQEMWDKYRAKDKDAKQWRQQGKVPVLSLGFGGGVGALQAMATNYGVSLTAAEAQVVVDVWRENNRWARAFWDALWDAFLSAMKNPGVPYEVGRVVYMYDADYMNGSMMCFLPDGRPLCYPRLKWREREREDREGNVTKRMELTYRRGYDTRSLWYGVLAENITQACAGSLLREVMVDLSPAISIAEARWITGPRPTPTPRLLSSPAELIGHTHDEVIAECDDNDDAVALAKKELNDAMVADRDWTEGLPLAAEVSTNWYYTKVVD